MKKSKDKTQTPQGLPLSQKPPKQRGDKHRRRRKYRGAQRHTSVYFLVWAIFTAFILLIVLLFGITQQWVMSQSYKNEASKEVSRKGVDIEEDIERGVPPQFSDSWSVYLRILSKQYDTEIYILSQEGRLVFPTEPNANPSDPDWEEYFDFTKEVEIIKNKIEKTGDTRVLFEGDGVYVYASEVQIYSNSTMYLYVGKSLALVETLTQQMNVRMILIAIFTSILGFAVSSAVAGWMTKPLSEMTEKAHLLAQGDFTVDFHGSDYGEEVVELADTLNYARDELSKTDRMQKELIANVSHDFKTPLTMIKAYASMIMEISGGIPEKRNKHAQVIVDEADRLTSLVSDLLDLSKIRSGLGEFERENVDVSELLRNILDRFAYLKETQAYQFITDLDEGLITCADEVKIGQALYNLIGNAVNYTGEDKKVYVRLKKDGEDTFRFEVRDTGKGIKPEDIPEIWDRYYRSREAHKRPVQGTGLGLSIVKTVLQMHKFAFGVESEVGKGSTFYVIFPSAQ